MRKRFADSPVELVALACGERMDWPDPGRLRTAIEVARAHVKLSHDVGSRSLRRCQIWSPPISKNWGFYSFILSMTDIIGRS